MSLERTLEVVVETIHHAFFGAATGAVLGLAATIFIANPAVCLVGFFLIASAAWSMQTLSMQ